MELTQGLFNWLVGVCGMLGSAILGVLWTMIKEAHAKNDLLVREIAETKAVTARRDELQAYILRLEEKIEKGFDRISDRLDKKADK